MKLNLITILPLFVLASAAIPGDLTSGEVFTNTIPVTGEGGHVYTKTAIETYTGQVTTTPTSGTITSVFTVQNSLATYTKTVVVTYKPVTTTEEEAEETRTTDGNTSNDVTTTTTISAQYQTYTKTITGESSDFQQQSSTGGAAARNSNGIVGAFFAVLALCV